MNTNRQRDFDRRLTGAAVTFLSSDQEHGAATSLAASLPEYNR